MQVSNFIAIAVTIDWVASTSLARVMVLFLVCVVVLGDDQV